MSLQSTFNQAIPSVFRQAWQLLTCPVWNYETHRLRAPLRAVLPLVLTFLAFAVLHTTVEAHFEHPVRLPVEMGGLALIFVGAILVTSRLIDKRPVTEFGLSLDRTWRRSFIIGGVIATVVNAGTMIVMLAAGWATVSGFIGGAGALPFLPAVLVALGYICIAAMWEEFIFRGTMLKNLAEGGNSYLPRWVAVGLALVLSSLVFAFMHSGKITDPSQSGYYLIAGLIFGSVYIVSGELALPMGFHVFYNFTMTAVFGLGVSQQSPELLVLDVGGPTFWVGEEGFVRVIFAVVGGVLLLAYVRWRNGHLHIADRVTQWTLIRRCDALNTER